MTQRQSQHALARLEVGFKTGSSRLVELQNDLSRIVAEARLFGQNNHTSGEWSELWQKRWDDVESILGRVQAHLRKMDAGFNERNADAIDSALESWKQIQIEELHRAETWRLLQIQSRQLSADEVIRWEKLNVKAEQDLDVIHACSQGLRVKLELLKLHSKEEVDQLVQAVLQKLPSRSQTQESHQAQHDEEYQVAAQELERERHKYMGFIDVVKGLLLWTETTEERSAKIHSVGTQTA